MHTVHLIAVEYDVRDTEGRPCAALSPETVSRLVDDAMPTSPEPWWDYYSVGGRWAGFFDGADYLTFHANPTVFAEALREVGARQDDRFRGFRDHITGAQVGVSDLSGHVFGLPVERDEAAAARATATNRASREAWHRVLAAQTIEELETDFDAQMALYRVNRLVALVEGRWNPDSMFYDTINTTAHPGELGRQLLQNQPDHGLALVAIDFHF